MSRYKWHFILALLGAYFFVQFIIARLPSPVLTPPGRMSREAFPVDFVLPSLGHGEIRFASLRGKVVLLNLWATWCSPCRAEMPSLQALYTDYRAQGVVILGVAMDTQGQTTVAPFMREYGISFPVLLDPHHTLGGQLRVQGIPTTYLLDQEGRIVLMEIGTHDWNALKVRHLLDRLLMERLPGAPSLVGEK